MELARIKNGLIYAEISAQVLFENAFLNLEVDAIAPEYDKDENMKIFKGDEKNERE